MGGRLPPESVAGISGIRNKEESKLSWEDTYKAMVDEKEHWVSFDETLLDGLEDDDFEN